MKYEIKKYPDGWWITFWDIGRNRRIKANGPFKTKSEAELDMEALNVKHNGTNR